MRQDPSPVLHHRHMRPEQQKQTSSCMCGRTEFKRERRNWFGLFGEREKWVKDGNKKKSEYRERKRS